MLTFTLFLTLRYLLLVFLVFLKSDCLSKNDFEAVVFFCFKKDSYHRLTFFMKKRVKEFDKTFTTCLCLGKEWRKG